jgi:hypothetical protein
VDTEISFNGTIINDVTYLMVFIVNLCILGMGPEQPIRRRRRRRRRKFQFSAIYKFLIT